MAASQPQLPADFRGEVRLFPLPDVVMFPSNALPLHIFESRYREMLEDAVQNDQLLTMATLNPGYESDYYSRPAVAPSVCIGQIAAYEKNDRGTYNLILVGLQRARIEHEIEPVRSFRRAVVSLLEEVSHGSNGPDYFDVGRQLVDCVRQIVNGPEKLYEAFSEGTLSLSSLSDILSFHLPLDISLKLRLLGEPDPMTRARFLIDNLQDGSGSRNKETPHPPEFSPN